MIIPISLRFESLLNSASMSFSFVSMKIREKTNLCTLIHNHEIGPVLFTLITNSSKQKTRYCILLHYRHPLTSNLISDHSNQLFVI